MKILKIDWLGDCNNCGDSDHAVHTDKGSDKWLYDGDKVFCDCGQEGDIECDGDVAWVNWLDLNEDRVKYNKLKIMYDKLKYLIMESNYGDEKYLRNYGAIE